MKILHKVLFCMFTGNLFAGSCKKSDSGQVAPPVVYKQDTIIK
jgi:hypothetical protein